MDNYCGEVGTKEIFGALVHQFHNSIMFYLHHIGFLLEKKYPALRE
jgi:hypothetical protein